MSNFSKRHFHDIDIKELIHKYKKYDCLWNYNSPNYKSKSLKQEAWQEISKYFKKDANEVKRKIKYLRSAYVAEKRRVDISRKSGSETHKPSLFYYNELNFLDSIVVLRKCGTHASEHPKIEFEHANISQDTEDMDDLVDFENEEDTALKEMEINCKMETYGEPEIEQPISTIKAINNLPKTEYSRSSSRSAKRKIDSETEVNSKVEKFGGPEIEQPISTRKPITSSPKIVYSRSLPRPVKRKIDGDITFNKSVPTATQSVSPKDNEHCKNLYISFGKTIALQLQQLPLEVGILAMSEIHTILTTAILEHLRSLQKDSSSSSHSESDSSYNGLIEESFNDSS